ncbi:MAG: hypothetical protein EOO65_00200 [Methanosarcinales archaeon]|nr:MAG: hypothetical protein EOO65_00200 [Methanosarcinales archaeon]
MKLPCASYKQVGDVGQVACQATRPAACMHTPLEELEEAGLLQVLRDMKLRAVAEPESPPFSSASPRAVMSCAAPELAAVAVTSAKL